MAGLLGAVTANPMMARQFATARQNMTAPTSVMDERYPAWKKSQDQATEFLLAADLIGSAVPAGLLAAPAMKKGLLSMGETLGPPVKRGLLDFADTAAPKIENYMERNGMLTRITAYHASPYKFDDFDVTKIGAGEGAQTYGHGLYLAESPKVSGKGGQYFEQFKNHPAVKETGGPFAYTVDIPDPMIAKMLDWDKPLSQQAPEVQKALLNTKNKQLRAIVDYASSPYSTPGLEGEVKTMGEAIKLLGMNASPAKGAAMLSKQGIPGIRYLDEGSRNTAQRFIAKHPMGGENSFNTQAELEAFIKRNPDFSPIMPNLTSNFVVFPGNEQLVKILSRE